MIITQLIYIFLLLLYYIQSKNLRSNVNHVTDTKDKLLFVWEHFRHGARGPYIGINSKTNLDSLGEKWDGTGEITPLGMRMHYLLGAATRKKYGNFLSNIYNPNEIFIISTKVNRTIVSINSFLQGLYNNSTSIDLTEKQLSRINILNSNYSEKINLKIKELQKKSIQNGINVVPVHTFGKNKLEFGLYDIKTCPGVEKYKIQNQKSEKVIKLYDELKKYTNDTFGEYIFKYMNITDPQYLWNKTNLYYLSDVFTSDYFDGRKMEQLNKTGIDMDLFYNNTFNVTYIDTYFYEFGVPSTETVYITVSPILRNMLGYIEQRIYLDKLDKGNEIRSDAPKFVILSGHDTSLAPIDIFMQSEFGIDFTMATYATNQIFELWKNGTSGNFYIKYLVNLEEKGIYDFDSFKTKVESKIYNQEQIQNICYKK